MKNSEIIKNIKGVFKLPVKRYYFGKIQFGCPYFYPINFNKWIISFRKLKLKSEQELKEYAERFPHLKDNKRTKFSNFPMVQRAKSWTFKLFGNYYWLEIGFPFAFSKVELGWKDKWNSPRHEWDPQWQLLFFGLELHCWLSAPIGDNCSYWEHILWFLKYSDKDIKKAEEKWGWTDMEGKSTWNKNYLL